MNHLRQGSGGHGPEDEKPSLLLKWGTLKAWDFEGCPAAKSALQRYLSEDHSGMAMTQADSEQQQQAILDMIDAVAAAGGSISNDWDGEDYTAEQAKTYILTYKNPNKTTPGQPK